MGAKELRSNLSNEVSEDDSGAALASGLRLFAEFVSGLPEPLRKAGAVDSTAVGQLSNEVHHNVEREVSCVSAGRFEHSNPPEISITPEMISAGVVLLPPLLSNCDDMEEAVIRIYRAMEKARSSPSGRGGLL
jgi:hypothetical protein